MLHSLAAEAVAEILEVFMPDLPGGVTDRSDYHGQVDSVMGPETEASVRWFQSVDKLPVTGQVNSATLRALRIS
jgi:peptidoglycan hydrolase-like protein with peptidoglycan-binding domain